MKHLFILSLLSLLTISMNAQIPTLDWVVGMGQLENDAGIAIAVDDSGNAYSTGTFRGTVDFAPGAGIFDLVSAGETDIYVQKLDASGALVWAVQLGGPGFETTRSIDVDGAGNVYLTGNFSDVADFDPGPGTTTLTAAGAEDIFICKLDPAGALLWVRQFSGALNLDIGHGIIVDVAGNVFTTGTFSATVDFDPGTGSFPLTPASGPDMFISKLDAAGDFVWAQQIGGSSLHFGLDIALDAAGNVFAAGHFRETSDFDPGTGVFNLTSGGEQDPFILKLDDDGAFQWAIQFEGPGNDAVQDISIDPFGNVLATGYFADAADFDPGAGTLTLTPGADLDIFIVKLSNAGDLIWARQISPGTFGDGSSIVSDADGNVYTSGFFTGTTDMDPGIGLVALTASGGLDFFLHKMDPAGTLVWALGMGGSENDEALSLQVSADHAIYVTGYFQDRVDFDPGPGVLELISAGGFDSYVLKLQESTTGIGEEGFLPEAKIYPNPAHNALFLDLGDKLSGQIRLLTIDGREVLEQAVTQQVQTIDLPESDGLYLLELRIGDQMKTWKISKQ